MPRVRCSLVLAFAAACGSTRPAPQASAAPATRAAPPAAGAAHPTAERCRAAIDHRDALEKAAPVDPSTNDQRAARAQAIEEARAAGILGDPSAQCTAHWTDAHVDCVLAATDLPTADACADPARE